MIPEGQWPDRRWDVRPMEEVPRPEVVRGRGKCKQHRLEYPWPNYRRCQRCAFKQWFWFCEDRWSRFKASEYRLDSADRVYA